MEIGGVFGLLILIGVVWAIINVMKSEASNGARALWIVLILFLPVLGLIVWFFAGPKAVKEIEADAEI